MPWTGASNIDAGVTVDLSEMNSVELLKRRGRDVTNLGPGARWGDIYRKLEAKGLIAAGPLADSVGVGGFYLSGKCASLLFLRRLASPPVYSNVLD